MSTAIRVDTKSEARSDTYRRIVMTFDEFTRQMMDWMARMRSETESERKRMERGDDLILMVQRSIVFRMMTE